MCSSSFKPNPIADPPPPEDESLPYFKALSRQATDRALNRSSGRAAAFGEPSLIGDLDFEERSPAPRPKLEFGGPTPTIPDVNKAQAQRNRNKKRGQQ